MNETRNYLASDLAAELGVPRTTLNDWLKNYAAFLETEPRGKRRAYTEKSLQVLRYVAQLRENGKSGLEIDAALGEKYGLRPEIAAAENQELPPENMPADTELPAVQMPATGISHFSGDDMNRFFKLCEEQQSGRRTARLISLFLILILAGIMAGTGAVLYRIYMRMEQTNQQNMNHYEALAAHLTGTGEALDKLARNSREELTQTRQAQQQALEKSTQEQRDALAKAQQQQQEALTRTQAEQQKRWQELAAELQKQNAEYRQAISGLQKEIESQRREREDFAARQRDFLQRIADSEKARTTLAENGKRQEALLRDQEDELRMLREKKAGGDNEKLIQTLQERLKKTEEVSEYFRQKAQDLESQIQNNLTPKPQKQK